MNNKENAYYQAIDDLNLYSSTNRLKYKLNFIFKEIDFINKNVLDIGGGIGILSFFAGVKGANIVVNLEPQMAGSSEKIKKCFNEINNIIKLPNVKLVDLAFEDFVYTEKFDIVILHNSINHLNEDACINLQKEENAKEIYKHYISKLYTITTNKAQIIICDCSNKNFFNDIGLNSPFDKNIEWEKHQDPNIWLKIFNDGGFEKVILKWSSFNRFGKLGNFLFGNSFFSYFFKSHFCLYVRKK